jgi:hypothetical protein
LDVFIRVLVKEEASCMGMGRRSYPGLVKWSGESGAIWLHMLISSGFDDQRSFPFEQLRRHLGEDRWAEYERQCSTDTDELGAFAARKVKQLDEYDEALEKMEEEKALVDSGKMTREAFIANALALTGVSYLYLPSTIHG